MKKFSKLFATTSSAVIAGTVIGFANPQMASAVTLGVSFQNSACNLNVFGSDIDCSFAQPLQINGTVDVDQSPSLSLQNFALTVLAPALSLQPYQFSKSDLDNLVSSGEITYSLNTNSIFANSNFSQWAFNISGNVNTTDGDIGSIGVDTSGLSFVIDASSDSVDTITIFGNALLPQTLPQELLTFVPPGLNQAEVEQFTGLLPKAPQSLPFTLTLSGDWNIRPVPEPSTLFGTAVLGVGGLFIKRRKAKKLPDVQAS